MVFLPQDQRPSTFVNYSTSLGAYVIAAGPSGGVNCYLGLPGAWAEAQQRMPKDTVPRPGKPYALELFIKVVWLGTGLDWFRLGRICSGFDLNPASRISLGLALPFSNFLSGLFGYSMA